MSWELEVNKLEEKQVKQVEEKREVELKLKKQQFEELKLKEQVEKIEDDRQPACGDAPA